MKNFSALPVAVLFCMLAAVPGLAQENAVWQGGGTSKSWNNPENWKEQRVPLPSASLSVHVESPDTTAFGFGGKNPVRFAEITTATNAGQLIVVAPSLIFGGTVNEEPEIGFIVDENERTGIINHKAPGKAVFRAPVTAASRLRVSSREGLLSFPEGVQMQGKPLTLAGPGPIELCKTDFSTFPVFFENAELYIGAGSRFTHTNGILLASSQPFLRKVSVQNGGTAAFFTPDDSIVVRGPIQLGETNAAENPDVPRDGSQLCFHAPSKTVFTHVAPVFGTGVSLTADGALHFALPAEEDERKVMAFGKGSTIRAKSIALGGSRRIDWRRDRSERIKNIDLIVHGPAPLPPGKVRTTDEEAASVITLDQGISVGGPTDENNSYHCSFQADGDVRISLGTGIFVPRGGGHSPDNKLSLSNGVSVTCQKFSAGASSTNTTVSVDASALHIGKEGFSLACSGDWKHGSPGYNNFTFSNRSIVTSESALQFGVTEGRHSGERNKFNAAIDNKITISGGTKFTTSGATLIYNHALQEASGNTVLLTDPKTVWDLSNTNCILGRAGSGDVLNNSFFIRNGATLDNVKNITVSAAENTNRKANGAKFYLQGGRVHSSGEVRIGLTGGYSGESSASTNVVLMAGTKEHRALWDFGDQDLTVGCSNGRNVPCRANRFHVQQNARIRALRKLFIGGGKFPEFATENVFALDGGVIDPIQELRIASKNSLVVTIHPVSKENPYGSSPLAVQGDIHFAKDSYLIPIPAKGTLPGKFPVLMWKGKAHGLENLVLHPNVSARWKILADPEKQRIFLEYR